jgi:hypothetical protein
MQRIKSLPGIPILLIVSLIACSLQCIALCGRLNAAQPSDGWWLCPGISLHRPCLCCPNDYCPKPMPGAPCSVCCGGPNDYCAKPLPCVSPYCCFDCNDYCGKPPPAISPCYTPPGSSCGPPDGPCSSCPSSSCPCSGSAHPACNSFAPQNP